MSPKFLNFEITLVYFFLLIPWPHTNVIKLICSQDNSRLVRKIIRSKWTPILDKYQMKLPLDCPLHPFRDIFGPRQDAKKRHRPTQWTCRLCGKSFFQEKYVDNHLENRHQHLINLAEDSVCFADFCDIMRCDVFQSEDSSLMTGDTHIVTDIEVWGDSFGQSSAFARANAAYLSLIPLRASAIGASRASKVQNRQLCTDKTSQNKLNDINKDNVKETTNQESDKVTNSNDSSMKNDQINSNVSAENNLPHNNSENIVNNIQKVKANCRSEELAKLKLKCEYLVRTCIAGLLLRMNDNSFKDMEDEMNKAICWYLSCDRYWEDGPLEPRAFPWCLILIIIMILSLGICFCYYIIWILFDSEESTIRDNNVQRLDYRHSPRYIPHRHQMKHHSDIIDRRDNTTRLSSSSIAIMDCDKDAAGGKSYIPDTAILRTTDNSEIGHNDHYIYVTYPPDLKKRLFDNYDVPMSMSPYKKSN